MGDVPGGSHAAHGHGGAAGRHHLVDGSVLTGDLLVDEGVSIRPGKMQFARMPLRAYCMARATVAWFTAALVA